jgi:hypothetical protein
MQTPPPQYAEPESLLNSLLALPDLDAALAAGLPSSTAYLQPGAAGSNCSGSDGTSRAAATRLLAAVDAALDAAYGPVPAAALPAGDASPATFSLCDTLKTRPAGDAPAALAPAPAAGPKGDAAPVQEPSGEAAEGAHTFLQRLLYRINRLAHFW